MVEQLTVNQLVPGSSPGRGAKNFKVLITLIFYTLIRKIKR